MLNVAYFSRDKFLVPLVVTYDLLVRRSGQPETDKRAATGQGRGNVWGGCGIHVGLMQRGNTDGDDLASGKDDISINF